MVDLAIEVDLIDALRILLIEDDEEVGQTLVRTLERSGMQTAWATTGTEGLRLRTCFHPDVTLVDLNLPDTDGISLVSWLSQRGNCGIILISGAGGEADRVVGLELGADDFITKPANPREMLARIRAVHRRVRTRAVSQSEARQDQDKQEQDQDKEVTIGQFQVDLTHRSVYTLSGERIGLTASEFAALEVMLAANGQPVSRDQLCEAALRRPWRPDDRSVDQLIFHLRQKLPGSYAGGGLIQSIRGAGYMLTGGRRT